MALFTFSIQVSNSNTLVKSGTINLVTILTILSTHLSFKYLCTTQPVLPTICCPSVDYSLKCTTLPFILYVQSIMEEE